MLDAVHADWSRAKEAKVEIKEELEDLPDFAAAELAAKAAARIKARSSMADPIEVTSLIQRPFHGNGSRSMAAGRS